MDLRHLHHFDTLAETGSLHRAAHRLGLRQPALSQSIRALEADVGTRLVERSPTGSRLTRAGTAFLHEVRAILTALDRATHIARLAANVPAPLRLSVTADIPARRLTALVQKFQEINRTPPVRAALAKQGPTSEFCVARHRADANELQTSWLISGSRF